MSDLPPPSPFDEQVSDLLDAGADAPAGDDALAARLGELRDLRRALADVPPPDPALRERSILAALAAFDADAGAAEADDGTGTAAGPPVAPVVPLVPRVAARRTANRLTGRLLGAAAAAVVLVGLGVAIARNGTNSGGKATSAAGDSARASGTTGAAAQSEAPAAGGASAQDTARSITASTAAASAATGASATTAAGASATTAAALPSTTAVAPNAATSAAGPLPYVGDVGSVADLDRVIRLYATPSPATTPAPPSPVPTTAGPATDGDAVRRAWLASGCPSGTDAVPVALLRYQGRPAVLVVLGDQASVWVVDRCAVVATRPVSG